MRRIALIGLLLAACEPPPPPDITLAYNEHYQDFNRTWFIRAAFQNNFKHTTQICVLAVFTDASGDTTHTERLLPQYAEPGEVLSFEFSVSSEAANGATAYRLSPVMQ